LWAETSGVASFRRTEWWAGARGHLSGVRSVERRARAIRLVVAPPAVWSDEREDGAG
jgi:hypothetical protein